jgi:hypothetical protein
MSNFNPFLAKFNLLHFFYGDVLFICAHTVSVSLLTRIENQLKCRGECAAWGCAWRRRSGLVSGSNGAQMTEAEALACESARRLETRWISSPPPLPRGAHFRNCPFLSYYARSARRPAMQIGASKHLRRAHKRRNSNSLQLLSKRRIAPANICHPAVWHGAPRPSLIAECVVLTQSDIS